MQSNYPLISCICITNNRPILLQKAIEYFSDQNYPNKQLVISFPESDLATRQIIEHFKSTDMPILSIERKGDESLGNARNHAVSKSQGEYICIWDDDDWYHSSRLSFQFNSIQDKGLGYQASILTRILLFDATTKLAYLSFPYTWDGTMLCKKEILLQNQYANSQKGEDTHVIKFLSNRKMLFHIDDVPFLYIYVYHGENTWNYQHFEFFLQKSERLSEDITNQVISLLEV